MRIEGRWSVVGCASANEAVLTSTRFALNADSGRLEIVNLHTGAQIGKAWTFDVAGARLISPASVSPDGLRVACLTYHSASASDWSVGRLLSVGSRSGRVRYLASIWVGDVRSGALREAATFYLPPSYLSSAMNRPNDVEMPSGLQWNPDNRAVTFLWKGQVWMSQLR